MENPKGTDNSTDSGSVVPDPDYSQAYQMLLQACPYIKLAHFAANQAIIEAFEGEEKVHVIDLDIRYGYQWPGFFQSLAGRPGGPPFVRITGVGFPLESVRETGRCLTHVAKLVQVPFEFHPVEAAHLQDLTPNMFLRHGGEPLAVNLVNWPRHDIENNCHKNLLTIIRQEAPKIVTFSEREPITNNPLGRLPEALHYYSVIFESLDVTFETDSQARAKVEKCVFAPEIRKLVVESGGGTIDEEREGVIRYEGVDGRMKIMEELGFHNVPLSENVMSGAKLLLRLYYPCNIGSRHTLVERKGFLLLGWRGTHIIATSAWRC